MSHKYQSKYDLSLQLSLLKQVIMASRKCKILNLECVDGIKQHDKGVSCRALAQTLNMGKSYIKNISDRAKIIDMWQTGVNCKCKVLKVRRQ